jgi:phage terminase large subunit
LLTSTRPTLNPVLRDFWTEPARNRVLYGGRSSSKSWDAAGFAIYLASTHRVRFLCTRQFQNKIAESVYTLLKVQIERFGLHGEFEVLRTGIKHCTTGSEFLFYGLWRHIDEIKSLEGIDVCWIEEAHNLTEEQWKILEPTLRNESSQFWVIFNPRLLSDFVYQRFVRNPPPDTVKREINYSENPFLSQTILKVIENLKAEDEDEYRHIYLGEPKTDDDQAVIKRSWVLAAVDVHKRFGITPTGRKRIGFDIADGGADKCATVMSHGVIATHSDEWKASEDELLKSCKRVHERAVLEGSEVDYDSIGIGAFAGAHFKELNAAKAANIQAFKFNASGKVIDPDAHINPDDKNSPKNADYYSNLKAQAWWGVADRFRRTYAAIKRGDATGADILISISSEVDFLDQLIDELSTPFMDFDTAGRVKVESKRDLAKREVRSPNLADAFIMAYAPREALRVAHEVEIIGFY